MDEIKENLQKEGPFCETDLRGTFADGFRRTFLLFLLFLSIGVTVAVINRHSFLLHFNNISFNTHLLSQKEKESLQAGYFYYTDLQFSGQQPPLCLEFKPEKNHYTIELPDNVKTLLIDFAFSKRPDAIPQLRNFNLWGTHIPCKELVEKYQNKSIEAQKNISFIFSRSDFKKPFFCFSVTMLFTLAFCVTLFLYGIWYLLLRQNPPNGVFAGSGKFDFALLFVVSAFTAMLLPLCRISEEVVDPVEKRGLRNFPNSSLFSFWTFSTFCKEWEKAYEDRFYGRTHLIRLKKFFFRGSDNTQVLPGNNNFLFLRESLFNPWNNFTNTTIYPESGMKALGDIFNRFYMFAKKRGKTFIFVMPPDKCRIYGEYVPYMNKALPDNLSGSEHLFRYLQSNYSFPSIYTKNHLLSQKKKDPSIFLYQHEDTHWTDYGAYYGIYLPVMEYLNTHGYNIPVYKPTWKKSVEKRGDLSWMLGVQKKSYSYFKDSVINYHHNIANYQELSITGDALMENKNGYPLNILFYRDSFMEKGAHFFGQTFKNVRLFWRTPKVEDLKYLEKADIIIYESVERFTGQYLLQKLSFPWEDK